MESIHQSFISYSPDFMSHCSQDGIVPLHAVAERGKTAIMEVILQSGGNVFATDKVRVVEMMMSITLY